MSWNGERGKIEQFIEANLNWWDEEARFWEKLLEILDTAATKDSFLEKTRREAQINPNPWLRDDLVKFVSTLERVENVI